MFQNAVFLAVQNSSPSKAFSRLLGIIRDTVLYSIHQLHPIWCAFGNGNPWKARVRDKHPAPNGGDGSRRFNMRIHFRHPACAIQVTLMNEVLCHGHQGEGWQTQGITWRWLLDEMTVDQREGQSNFRKFSDSNEGSWEIHANLSTCRRTRLQSI